MVKKLAGSIGMMSLVGLLFFASPAYAHKDFGPASWRTEDGAYELTVRTDRMNRHVHVNVWNLQRASKGTGESIPFDARNLVVRLCTVTTGKCTSFKKLTDPLAHDVYGSTFTNMIPGRYRVDIRDHEVGFHYKGLVRAAAYSNE